VVKLGKHRPSDPADPITYFAINCKPRDILTGAGPQEIWPPYPPGQEVGEARLLRTPAGVLVKTIAALWNVNFGEVLRAAGFDFKSGRFEGPTQEEAKRVIGDAYKGYVGEQIFLIRKPGS
jgi:hypothetical protein